MKVNILTDEEMKNIGFIDRSKERWHFSRCVGYDISFNLSINKSNSKFRIDVIDDDFAQPYDYQYMLVRTPSHSVALEIKEKVERLISYLSNEGIIEGYEQGQYI